MLPTFGQKVLERVLARALRRGVITMADETKILERFKALSFQDFIQFLLENYPEIIEMILAFMEIIMLFTRSR